MISVIIIFERVCFQNNMSAGNVKTLIHKSMSERKCLEFQIRKSETKTSGCDREWRENKSSILQKTY